MYIYIFNLYLHHLQLQWPNKGTLMFHGTYIAIEFQIETVNNIQNDNLIKKIMPTS